MLTNTPHEKGIYVQFNNKTGLFETGSKKQNTLQSFDTITSAFVQGVTVREKQAYNQPAGTMEKYISVKLKSATDGSSAFVNFNMGTLTTRMLGILIAADLTKPIQLRGGSFEAGTTKEVSGQQVVRDSAESFLVAHQNDQKIKPWFSDDPNFQFPKTKFTVEVAGEMTEVKNFKARDAYILELAAIAGKNAAAAVTQQPHIQVRPTPAPAPTDAAPAEGASDDGLNPEDFGGIDDDGASDAERFGQPG